MLTSTQSEKKVCHSDGASQLQVVTRLLQTLFGQELFLNVSN